MATHVTTLHAISARTRQAVTAFALSEWQSYVPNERSSVRGSGYASGSRPWGGGPGGGGDSDSRGLSGAWGAGAETGVGVDMMLRAMLVKMAGKYIPRQALAPRQGVRSWRWESGDKRTRQHPGAVL